MAKKALEGLKRVCVFCGSRAGENPAYAKAAESLADAIVRRRAELVYGGGNVGLMGRLADAVLAREGRVIGVIPRSLRVKEVAHNGLTDLKVVESMHERKAVMAELSDGFVALPGGIGTLEEFFETWTWAQLGLHHKPFGLLDVDGFFSKLIGFLDHLTDEGFLKPKSRAMVLVETNPDALLDKLAAYVPPPVAKWIDTHST